ncbi:MAG: hypothetical protein WA061_02435 [Microgenomates group bacterium]
MSKKSGRHLSKKWMPKGASKRRVTNAEGKRVFVWDGQEYPSLKSLIFRSFVKPADEKVEPVEIEVAPEVVAE